MTTKDTPTPGAAMTKDNPPNAPICSLHGAVMIETPGLPLRKFHCEKCVQEKTGFTAAHPNGLLSHAELDQIKSHVVQWDSTAFQVRRAIEDRDRLLAHIEALSPTTAAQGAVAEGWPTEEMVKAATRVFRDWGIGRHASHDFSRAILKAALAAAPKPPEKML